MNYKRLGERIREERQRLNLTQAALAEAVDISNTYMGAIKVLRTIFSHFEEKS